MTISVDALEAGIVVREYFCSHQPLRSGAKTHHYPLAGTEFRQTKTPQRFHVNKNVFVFPRYKPVPLDPVEPIYLNALEITLRLHIKIGFSARLLMWVGCVGFIHGQHTQCLQAALSVNNLTYNTGALRSSLEAIISEAGYVQQDVGHVIIRHDETIAF